MLKKLKAFISIAVIALPLFIAPVSILLEPSLDGSHEIAVTVQPLVAYAADANCGVIFGGSILACIPGLWKMTVFWPVFFIVKGAGLFFDFFMSYSISSHTFSSATELVSEGWAIVRDISNIFFIFVLLYIAIGTILNLSQVNTKKMLVKVIIIALLINFSLFFTRVIIDASNILAGAFAGSIELNVTNIDADLVSNNGPQYSAGIISIFNPQTLLGTEQGSMLEKLYEGVGGFQAAGTEIAFIIIVSLVLLAMSYVFVSVGIMLLGRVVELWYLMIISPIAFISIIVPFKIPQFGWDEWFKKLISAAFLAPVFMFFLYLIILFLNLGLDAITFDPSGSFWNPLLQMVIPFIVVLILIIKAKKIAEKMSGEIGAAFGKLGGVVAGLGVAALSGGTSLALRGTVGRAGASMAKSEMGGTMGRMTRRVGNKLNTGSMDWRQTSKGQSIMKDMGMGSSASSFSSTGGHQGFQDRYQASRESDKKQRTENIQANDNLAKNTTKAQNDVQKFDDHFAKEIRKFDEDIKELKETLSLAPELAKPDIFIALEKKKEKYTEFKNGGENGDKKVSVGLDSNGKEVMKSHKELKDALNASTDAAKKVDVKISKEVGDEIRGDRTSGLTQAERDSIASKVEGKGASGGGKKKRKERKEKKQPSDDE